MPGDLKRAGDFVVGQWRCAGQVKNMCTRNWLRAAGRSGDPHHQAGDGQVLLRRGPARESVCGEQVVEEDNVRISVREVGAAKVVEFQGEVKLSTPPDPPRPL